MSGSPAPHAETAGSPRSALARFGLHTGHLRTILWLRRRISRNQWSRAGSFAKFLHVGFVALGAVVSIGGLALGIGLGIALSGPSGALRDPEKLLAIWDVLVGVFLFFWVGYLLVDVQRSETVDAAKLLHLPVTHGQVFVLNYLAAWVTPMVIATAPGLLGFAIGLSMGIGARFLWLVPLVLGFFILVTSFTYWLRGWLAALMANPRRRRSILVGVGMGVVLLSQLPNIWFNVLEPPERARSVSTTADGSAGAVEPGRTSRIVHRVVPILWLPGGAAALARGNVWPAALGAAGSLALGAWALRRAHRSALRAYLGVESAPARTRGTRDAIAGPTARRTGRARRPLVERSLPFVSGQTSAIAMATLRSYLRAPESRMGLAMPFVMLVCFTAMVFRPGVLGKGFEPLLPGSLATCLLFGWLQFSVNSFGFDRGGFRALLLSPVPRRRILLGKNLALLVPSAIVQGIVTVVLLLLGRYGADLVAAGLLQFLTGFLVMSTIGNWASVAAPYRISQGTMRRPKLSRKAVVTGLAIAVTFPIAQLPALAPSLIEAACRALAILPGVPIALLTAPLFLALAIALHSLLLGEQGRHLARREQEVLEIVTHEIE